MTGPHPERPVEFRVTSAGQLQGRGQDGVWRHVATTYVPRDFRWNDAPRPDPDTGTAPLAPTAAADDVAALRAEARAWCADPAASLRSAIVADLEHALGRALARAEAAERDRDRLARRVRAMVAIGQGVRVPDELADADPGPCGWATR